MSDTIIRVENLGKKYLIKHQQQGNYTALRDVITDKVKSLGKKIISPWNHKRSSTYSTTEEFWALKDISFKVKQGEVIGIIGRNGAGKSTLLKIISRITEPTKGRIRINGRVASLLEVGTGFHPELTGRENIFLNGAILGMGKAEIKRKFDEIVTFAEVEKFLDTPVKRYSSGMYVRLAFAVAAHLEPEILVVDEVLAVGDASFQKKCLGKMHEVAGEGQTVIFVSHNMGAVQQLCTRAILIDGGKIIKDSNVSESVAIYLSTAIKQSGGNHNLLKFPRKDASYSNIKLKKCLVLDSNNNETYAVKYSESFSIIIEAISAAKYENLTFVVCVDSINGVRVFSSLSSDSDILFSVSPQCTIKTTATISDIWLTPGVYNISLAIRSGKISLDTLMNVITFEVLSQVYNDNKPYSGAFGLIFAPTSWMEIK
ncbi:ABC transporter ATP-binding protein [Desulfobacteraceae bacterium SEEP-SAG9]|nr:ABC transporter ATP-binding protein [Desulfobacteraceae bacterium SEEP-SAG9]